MKLSCWWVLYLEPNSGLLVTLRTDWHTPPWWVEKHMKLEAVRIFEEYKYFGDVKQSA